MKAPWWWPLVQTLALRMVARMPAHVDRRDLEMAGAERVLKARIDPSASDVQRTAFVRKHAQGGMLDELRVSDPIEKDTRRVLRQVDKAGRALVAAGERPTTEAIAKLAGVTPAQVLAATGVLARMASLHANAPVLDQVIQPDEIVEQRQSLGILHAAVDRLPGAQRAVMKARLRGTDTADTARDLGITREALWNREAKALANLRRWLVPANHQRG